MDLQRLGKYEIVSKIGEGAMGEVYRAYDPVLGRDVAVKTMTAAVGADADLRRRFHREAQSAARLNHPNIITVFDFGEEGGRVYIAMELLEGYDLKDLIGRKAPLSLDEKLSLMEQIADGLAFAHSRDVVHRDLKPANIHIQRGQVKIMDFGLARVPTSDMTRAGVIMGTPNYMSPEQVRGERATARSDVFSLGSVFYELLTYRKPFDADTLHAVLYQVLQSEPEPLAKAVPSLPAALHAVIEKALAKEPLRRYMHAGELREALRPVRASVPSVRTAVPMAAPSDETRGLQRAVIEPSAKGPGTMLHVEASPSETAAPGETVVSPAPPPERTARAVVTARPGATAAGPAATQPAAPATAVHGAVALEPTRVLPVSPAETLAVEAPRTLSGRTATQVPGAAARAPAAEAPARSERAAETPPARRSFLPAPLLAVGGAAIVAVGVYVGIQALRVEPSREAPASAVPASVAPPPTLAVASPAPARPEASTAPSLDQGEALAEARRSLTNKDYRLAATRAESVLAREPDNTQARRLLEEARRTLRQGEAVVAEIKTALAGGNAEGASLALARLAKLDPRHPEVPTLSVRVNEAMSRRTQEAHRALEQARRQATPTPALASAAPPASAASVAPSTPLPGPTAPPATLAPPTVAPPTLPVASPAAPVAPLTGAQIEAARKSIRGVLEEYRAAVETRNADYLRRLHPSLDYEGMKASFAAVSALDVKIDVKDVSVSGETATANCLVTYTPKPKPAGQIKPVATQFRMKRTGDVWIIEDVVRK